jgi:hypothetical protein
LAPVLNRETWEAGLTVIGVANHQFQVGYRGTRDLFEHAPDPGRLLQRIDENADAKWVPQGCSSGS